MKINKKKLSTQWFTYEDGDEKAEFNIRPYPFSHVKLEAISLMDEMLIQFNYCLVDWKGIDDDDGTALECNEENKQMIFDHVEEVRDFVFTKAKEMNEGIVGEIKN